jgi:hypothetical protein
MTVLLWLIAGSLLLAKTDIYFGNGILTIQKDAEANAGLMA